MNVFIRNIPRWNDTESRVYGLNVSDKSKFCRNLETFLKKCDENPSMNRQFENLLGELFENNGCVGNNNFTLENIIDILHRGEFEVLSERQLKRQSKFSDVPILFDGFMEDPMSFSDLWYDECYMVDEYNRTCCLMKCVYSDLYENLEFFRSFYKNTNVFISKEHFEYLSSPDCSVTDGSYMYWKDIIKNDDDFEIIEANDLESNISKPYFRIDNEPQIIGDYNEGEHHEFLNFIYKRYGFEG